MAWIFSIFLCLAFMVAENFGDHWYCNPESAAYKTCHETPIPDSDHTVCIYPSSEPSKSCGKIHTQGVTNTERNYIVEEHNRLRQKLATGHEPRGKYGYGQPAAEKMPNLTWDRELEQIAQRWADQCHYDHDGCRDVDRFPVGQNIAKMWGKGQEIVQNGCYKRQQINDWYDEVENMDPDTVTAFQPSEDDDEPIGHYTQVVWATSTTIGCGYIAFKTDQNYCHFVCNYGPSGNYYGEPVYEPKY